MRGPIYGVDLSDPESLPVGGGMLQALPSDDDLRDVAKVSLRTAAGYEVLFEHYRRLRAIVDRLPRTADGVPLIQGDTIYAVFGDEVEAVTLAHPVARGEYVDCYSTREAAEAAVKGATP